MNRKYVILTPEIGNMGGAQMYVENKVKYLRENNWEVCVFYYIYGENYKLPVLTEFKDNCIHDFLYAFYYIPFYERKKILDVIANKVGSADEIIVESQLITLAYWGELIAEKLGGRHIVNFLEEQVPVLTEKEYDFFRYKLKRWEFMNAGKWSLKRVFKERLTDELLKYEHSISFQCSNVVDENATYNGSFADCDYTIISIGRLDKQYVIPIVEEIKLFAQQNGEKRINVVFVGGSLDGTKETMIPQILNETNNITCYMLGFTYPVPANIVKMADVAIASANAVLVTADYGVPTICVDMNDSYAIGVYGYSTQNKHVRKDEPLVPVSALLNDILIESKYPRKAPQTSYNQMKSEFDHQMDFLNLIIRLLKNERVPLIRGHQYQAR